MTDLYIGIISLAHAPVPETDFFVVNVHVDELSSARIWKHKLCAKFSASVNINYVYNVVRTTHFWKISKFLGAKNPLSLKRIVKVV